MSQTEPVEFKFDVSRFEPVVCHLHADPVDKPGCETVHAIDETLIIDLHFVNISMNDEAVLINDATDVCSVEDEKERSEHRALRHATEMFDSRPL